MLWFSVYWALNKPLLVDWWMRFQDIQCEASLELWLQRWIWSMKFNWYNETNKMRTLTKRLVQYDNLRRKIT